MARLRIRGAALLEHGACSEGIQFLVGALGSVGLGDVLVARDIGAPVAFKIWTLRCYAEDISDILEDLSGLLGSLPRAENIYAAYRAATPAIQQLLENRYFEWEQADV